MNHLSCCDEMIKAQELDTDIERYGPCVFTYLYHRSREGYHIAPFDILSEIKFCPWCGQKINSKEEQ